MGGGRKTERVTVQEKIPKQKTLNAQPWSARNLSKKDLAGVIFACKYSTYKECFSKLLFGLPSAHFAYVQNVRKGMPIFLFNCTDRKMHGIYEAASSGQMEIDKYAWVSEGSETTQFPAQVRVKILNQCQALVEDQYKPIIAENYHQRDPHFFWFELDREQTQKLVSLFSASPVNRSVSKPQTPVKWGSLFEKSVAPLGRQGSSVKATNVSHHVGSSSTSSKATNVSHHAGSSSTCVPVKSWSSLFNSQEQDPVPYEKSEKSDYESLCTMSEDDSPVAPGATCVNVEASDIPAITWDSETPPAVLSEGTSSPDQEISSPDQEVSSGVNSDIFAVFDKLLQTLGEIKELQLEQTQKIENLDLELAQVDSRLRKLECHSGESGSSTCSSSEECCDTIYIVGGFDGSSWLQDLISYLPSEDLIQPLEPMSSIRPYAAAVELNGEIYVLGGGHGATWYNTVESYNLGSHSWVSCPVLNTKKGSLAGASLLGKIFAMGGCNEDGCLSEVEMLDFNVGKWLPTRSMVHKRYDPAAAELNGVLYVAGGYDGQEYLRSVERFDPREHSWTQLKPLNTKRACHSLTVLNDKLYAIGGYDGSQMVSSVEVFEPRVDSWTMSESMTTAKGYMGTATLGNTIYSVGGMLADGEILDTVECYSEDEGWRLVKSKSIGRRCFCPAVVCNLSRDREV